MKKQDLNLTVLENSLQTLKECYEAYNNQEDLKLKEYIKDSCIKRFEYTYESAKKIMNKYLKKEYDKTEKELSINNIFREMYGLELIDNFENWSNYREKRNYTSHEYNNEYTYSIVEILPNFINDVEYLIKRLNEVLLDD